MTDTFLPNHGILMSNIDLFLNQHYCYDYDLKKIELEHQIKTYHQQGRYRRALDEFVNHLPSKTADWCLDAYDSLNRDHPECFRCQRALVTLFIQLYAIHGTFFRRPIVLRMDVDPKVTQTTGHISPSINFSLSHKGGQIRFGLTLEHILNKDNLATVYVDDCGYSVQTEYIGQYIYNVLHQDDSV